MKHYNSVDFLSNFRMSIPLNKRKSLNYRPSGDGSVGNAQRQGIALCTCNWKRSKTTPRQLGVGASKFLGVKGFFAQIFPNLPKKLLCNFCRPFLWCDLQKMVFNFFLQTLGTIFRSQTMLDAHFAQIFNDFA